MSLVSTLPGVPKCRHPAGGGAGLARYAAQLPGADKLLASLPQGPMRGRGQRAPASGGRGQRRRRGAPGNAALAALLRAERLPGYRGGSGGRGAWGPAWRRRRGICWPCPAHAARRCWWRWRTCPGFATPAWRACWMRCNMRRWRRRRIGDSAAIRPRGPAASAGAVERGRGARRLLGQPGLRLVEVEDPGVLLDIDTPADLDRAG